MRVHASFPEGGLPFRLLVLSFFLPFTPALIAGEVDVVINEVLYSPPGGFEDAEFIELFNGTEAPVDVSRWRLTEGVTLTFPNGASIPAGGYLLVVKSATVAAALYPGVARVGPYSGSLDNGGERIRLENAGGTIIDEFEYSDGDAWPGGADGSGASLEKLSPESDPWFADSWGASLTLLGSPGKLNTQYREIVDLDLVLRGEDWRYWKGIEEPSGGTAAWAAPTHDDSAWLVGPTGIGYGDLDDATVLEDMQGVYSTLHMRRRFEAADPSRIIRLLLTVDYDDGFVLYLNGEEVERRNAGGSPGVPLPASAEAPLNHEAGAPEVLDLTDHIPLLVPGSNVIAIHGINQTLSSTDFTMIPSLSAQVEVIGADISLNRLASTSTIPRSSVWSYWKGVAEPSGGTLAWTTPGFDAASWPTGPAGFGFGDSDDATVLTDMLNGYSTLYVRRTFTIDDIQGIVGMTLGVDHDDGFIAYLNGEEVARAFAPGQTNQAQPHTAVATGSHEAGTEGVFDITADASLLVEGENVLALQGLNVLPSNGDFSLHPRLTLLRAVRGDPAALGRMISINEVHAPGGGAGWVEIHNGGHDPVDLSSHGLSDDAANPLRHVLSPSSPVPAGEFLVIPEASLGFVLPATGTLLLTDPAGVVVLDGRSYSIPIPTLSAGSFPDGEEKTSILGSATPGSANAPPPPRGVVINEIMYHPSTAPGAEELEWIELHNPTAGPVSLGGWRFTSGIHFAFPPVATIPAGAFLVVARDPAGVAARHGISGVVGGYTSGLRNDDETIVLRDQLDNEVDRVHYADDGRWPEQADGGGPSVELVNPALDNHTGHAWQASDGEGTPGAPNSRLAASAAPLVTRLRHSPLVPRAGQPVAVAVEVLGLDPILEVRLFHRRAGDAAFEQILMEDDGASGDGSAGDRVHGAVLPGRPAGDVVEFFVEAEDESGQVRRVPGSAPAACSLYLVDDSPVAGAEPVYRIVMTPADRQTLETRDAYSNVLLNATFIASNDVHYGVGVRYRGESSRALVPRSYRLDFPDDEEFEGIKHLNLNASNPQHQHEGMVLFRGAGVPAPLTRPVLLAFGADPERTYTRMEEVDDDFLRRRYPRPEGEDEGNLYRGVDGANLDHRGASEESYRPSYRKLTNEDEDDWSDLIDLCDKLTNTPVESLPSVLPALIDVDEWIRFFAVHALIATQESGIHRDSGDDYHLYRRPSDNRWILIPWDLDESFSQPTEMLFRPSLPQVRRILEHPEWSTSYYSHIVRLSSSHFSLERMTYRLGLLTPLVSTATLQSDLSFTAARLGFLDSAIQRQLSVEVSGRTLVEKGAVWRFFRGTAEPSGGALDWTLPDFDDASWESGPTGIGYGDGDDATLLEDMLNGYTSVYARHELEVPDPSSLTGLELSIDHDDGFVAFLNGVEIARANAGPDGTYPAFDGVATASREAGAPQTFDVTGALGSLVAGRNVLAVVGLNLTLDSTDFSLVPELRTGGVVGVGCPGEHYVTGEMFLSGTAPVTETRYVRVNGADADYDRFTGRWSIATPVGSTAQTVIVEALTSTLSAAATETLTLQRVRTLGGVLSGDVDLTSETPFLVNGSVTVAAGARVTVRPGALFLVLEGKGFVIEGRIQALGTQAEPIVFTRVPCHENWGFVTFQNTLEGNELRFCELSRSDASPGCLTVQGSNLEIESCHIHDIVGEGVSAFSSTINVRNTVVERTNEALSLDFCRTIVEFNTLRNAIGKSDLCDANGSNNPPARIAFNTFQGTSDDGIDADRGSVFAEGNFIRNCGDQAISLVGAGNSTVIRNILFRNNVGLSVKDSHVATADFNTMAFNTSIGVRGIEKTAGQGGGIIVLRNSIVWGSPTSLFVNSTGVITTTYSDVQGAAPPPGAGNINVDPLFVSAGANDYRLQATSPCIGTAENGEDMGALPYELAPRAPTSLAATSTTPSSVSLAWIERSNVETAIEVHRRASVGFSPEYLVSRGSSWRFFRGRQEPSAGDLSWAGREFDDATWEQGPSGIGYGDGDDATVLADMQNGYSTVYMRKTFVIEDPDEYTALEIVMDFDDGFIAFLNGIEIARQGAGSSGTWLPFDGLAASDHEAGAPHRQEVDVRGVLVSGANVLAVQAVNILRSSSDLTAIPELRTTDETPYALLASLPPNARVYTDFGLGAGVTYSYRVRAVNGSGASSFSNTVTVDTGTVPSAPEALLVIAFDPGSIGLEWTDTSADEESFQLERAVNGGEFSLLASLPPDSESHLDMPLVAGAIYSYRVRAVNHFGASAYSNTVTQAAGTPPVAPGPLAVIAVTIDSLELAWMDNSSDETAFEVEIRVGNGQFQQRAVLTAGTASYLDTDLLSGQTYTYRVRAVNLVGPSDYSNEVSASTGNVPATPDDLTLTGVELDAIRLSWVDAADDEIGYEVERRGPGDAEFGHLESLPAGSSSTTDSGLPPGTTFSYRVRAINVFGASPYSNTVTAATGRLPLAPSGLFAAPAGSASAEVTWVDSADNESAYEVERDAGSGFDLVASLEPNAVSYLDAGLGQGVYAYRVRAVNSFGPSEYAGPVTISTELPAPMISVVEPAEGPASGGTRIAIAGTGFTPGAEVSVGGRPLSSLEVVSATRIEGFTPPGDRGPAEVRVTTPHGTAVLDRGFAYQEAFLRGEANQDGLLDISDPLYILQYLFLSGPEPPCADVGDANFDGALDLSDAVYILSHLFLGGPPILPEEARCD